MRDVQAMAENTISGFFSIIPAVYEKFSKYVTGNMRLIQLIASSMDATQV
jgi:hypothetical protein